MMRGVIVYGALLAVTLGASYYRWTHEPDKALEGKVVVLQGEPDTLDRVTWKGKDDEAVIEKKKDDRGDYYWVTYTKWEKKKPEHPDAKDTGEGIAKWWLAGTDAESKKKQVQNALDCLTARGWLTKRETSRREKIYGLNRNLLPEIRGFLRIQGTLAH